MYADSFRPYSAPEAAFAPAQDEVSCAVGAFLFVSVGETDLTKGLHAAGKAPEAQNARGESDKTRQGIAVHSPAKRESDRVGQPAHTVASGATPDHSAARVGGVTV